MSRNSTRCRGTLHRNCHGIANRPPSALVLNDGVRCLVCVSLPMLPMLPMLPIRPRQPTSRRVSTSFVAIRFFAVVRADASMVIVSGTIITIGTISRSWSMVTDFKATSTSLQLYGVELLDCCIYRRLVLEPSRYVSTSNTTSAVSERETYVTKAAPIGYSPLLR